jgi:hypothetical protein
VTLTAHKQPGPLLHMEPVSTAAARAGSGILAAVRGCDFPQLRILASVCYKVKLLFDRLGINAHEDTPAMCRTIDT